MPASLIAIVLAAGLSQAPAGTGAGADQGAGASAGQESAAAVDPSRGEYLARVGLCVECHTPRDGGGQLIAGRLLAGAPLPLGSPFPGPEWAYQAPRLRGLPAGYEEADLVRLLTTGERPRGGRPRRPMPDYRLTPEDARAIVAYLRSLPVP